jgi:hypothetical protein
VKKENQKKASCRIVYSMCLLYLEREEKLGLLFAFSCICIKKLATAKQAPSRGEE